MATDTCTNTQTRAQMQTKWRTASPNTNDERAVKRHQELARFLDCGARKRMPPLGTRSWSVHAARRHDPMAQLVGAIAPRSPPKQPSP